MTTTSGKYSNTLRKRLIDDFNDEDFRRTYAEEFLDTSISAQIRALREQRGLSQGEFGKLIGTTQGGVSTFESTEYSSWSINTLKKMAAALDLALVVRFASFGEILDRITGFSREALEKPSFKNDPVFKGEETITPNLRKTYLVDHYSWAQVLSATTQTSPTERIYAEQMFRDVRLRKTTIPPVERIARETHAEKSDAA
jgi:transcriptional regulator with XRE-family HTH domain